MQVDRPDIEGMFYGLLTELDLAKNDTWPEPERPYFWDSPPLFMRASLRGIDISPLWVPRIDMQFGEVLDVYESFIERFIHGKENISTLEFLTEAFHFDTMIGSRLFSKPKVRDRIVVLHKNLVQMAALIYGNFGGRYEAGPHSAVVIAQGCMFGIADGHLISNREQAPVAVKFEETIDLSDVCRQPGYVPDTVSEWDQFRFWLERNVGDPDQHIWHLALRAAFWWREFPLSEMWRRRGWRTDSRLIEGALDEARTFSECDDPLQFLYRTLVPEVIKAKVFQKLFSNPWESSFMREAIKAEKWNQSLNFLDEVSAAGRDTRKLTLEDVKI